VSRIDYRVVPLDEPTAGFPGRRFDWFPVAPVKLRHGGRSTPWFASFVDTGSHCCLFDASLAKLLDLDLASGSRDVVRGLADETWIEVRFFEVTLIVAAEAIVIPVGFCNLDPWPGLLGRAGFFERFTVTFDHASEPPGMDIERIRR
jgi:hypothetical protein